MLRLTVSLRGRWRGAGWVCVGNGYNSNQYNGIIYLCVVSRSRTKYSHGSFSDLRTASSALFSVHTGEVYCLCSLKCVCVCVWHYIVLQGSVSSIWWYLAHTHTHTQRTQQLSAVFFLLFLPNYSVALLELTSQSREDNTLISLWTKGTGVLKIYKTWLLGEYVAAADMPVYYKY